MSFRRLYVPLATALLVLVLGNWWAITSNFDPQLAAQEERLHFKTAQLTVAEGTDLSAAEVEIARGALKEAWKEPIATSARPQLLYSGNSQTLAIMDGHNQDLLAPQWLAVMLNRRSPSASMDVRLASLPNLSPAEALIILVSTAERTPRRGVDVAIFSQALREFRGVAVREELLPLLTPQVKEALTKLGAECSDLPAALKVMDDVQKEQGHIAADGGANGTATVPIATRIDRQVNAAADKMPLFGKRKDLYAELKVWIYWARNSALGINTASARAIAPPMYQANMQLVEMALRYAKTKEIPVFGYLAPIRPIEPNPNKKSDVVKFRKDVPALYAKYGAPMMDYTDLVAEELWTEHSDADSPARDYDHFTGRGHKLLADTLMKDLGSKLAEVAARKSGNGVQVSTP